MSRLRLAVLGSTGSIGRQALDVAARFPDRIEVVALAASRSADALAEQAAAFGVSRTALADRDGAAAVEELASFDGADIVLNALVGAAGLRATVAALTAGKRLALANKESLVVGGELVTALASPGTLIPVDSEHSAIFQCMVGESPAEVSRIWLTASGGPFRGMTREQLASVTVEQALKHPRWTMGPKITIDSATLMNKGLEAIEAHHLFALGYDRITIVVHPQSCVHSMVEFVDGSVKAHLGATDMRVPIQYALSFPDRWEAPVRPVDFTTIGSLEFGPADPGVFRCLELALEAGAAGGTMPAAMNAANEVAVAAFLAGKCSLTDIDRVVGDVMTATNPEALTSVEQVESVDAEARARAAELLGA